MNKPKLNVGLLRRVLKHLRDEPRRYNQGNWAVLVDPTLPTAPACGTQGCIAGWAVLLNVPQELWSHLLVFAASGGIYAGTSLCTSSATAAQRLLGLTDQEAVGLFQSINQSATTGEAGVKEAAAKINLLIKSRTEFVRKYA